MYNLTVFDSRKHLGTCYLWHAGIAKRGANEIASAVIEALLVCSQEGKKEVKSFSDSCSGQNRNRFVYAMFLIASARFNIKIRHCFLEPGHTYNDADGVHARIDRHSDGKDIWNMEEWINIIKTAKVEDPAYRVKVMKRTSVRNFHEIVDKQNWELDTDGRKIAWNKVKIVEAGYEAMGVLGFLYEYGGEKHYLNTRARRGHPVNLKTYEPPLAYSGKIPLKKKTIDHLRQLMKTLAIPSKYHAFFETIFSDVEPTDEDDDPEDPQVLADSWDPDQLVGDNGEMEALDDLGLDQEAEAHDDEGESESDDEINELVGGE